MRKNRLWCAAIILLAVPSLSVFARAGGLGGIGLGTQYFSPEFSSGDLGMSCITGYGYGVTWGGQRIGGFGMALLSFEENVEGGVGGLLVGQELRSGPIVLGANLLLGVGGVSWYDGGYMLLFAEADVEIGVRLFPWMQIVLYGGYQAWGNFIPGRPLSAAGLYTPVCGIRLGWGSP